MEIPDCVKCTHPCSACDASCRLEELVRRWNVAVEIRNSAWVTWKRVTFHAIGEDEAKRRALEWAHANRAAWTEEHDDYCPQDWQFRVIGIIEA